MIYGAGLGVSSSYVCGKILAHGSWPSEDAQQRLVSGVEGNVLPVHRIVKADRGK